MLNVTTNNIPRFFTGAGDEVNPSSSDNLLLIPPTINSPRYFLMECTKSDNPKLNQKLFQLERFVLAKYVKYLISHGKYVNKEDIRYDNLLSCILGAVFSSVSENFHLKVVCCIFLRHWRKHLFG